MGIVLAMLTIEIIMTMLGIFVIGFVFGILMAINVSTQIDKISSNPELDFLSTFNMLKLIKKCQTVDDCNKTFHEYIIFHHNCDNLALSECIEDYLQDKHYYIKHNQKEQTIPENKQTPNNNPDDYDIYTEIN